MSSFYIRSFGCQMNEYDARRIASMLAENQWEQVDDYENADAIIFNTCYIREKAADKVWSELGRIRDAHGDRPIIALIGCLAKAEEDKVFKRAPNVSVVLSSRQYHKLPAMLAEALKGKRNIIDTDLDGLEKFAQMPDLANSNVVEFLQIQEGCDQYCTYCCVPYTRGREISRPFADVIKEANSIADKGAKEIVLVGQNVNAYEYDLAKLIGEIAKTSIQRIRYTTSYPSRYSEELIALHGKCDKLMPLLYLPVQSGSDRILAKMNRKYTRDSYLEIIRRIKNIRADLQVSSDFIVGFPTETDEDFNDTLSIVREVKFIQSFSFKYSPRKGTAAATMDGQVQENIKTERIMRLQEALRDSQDSFNKSCVGQTHKVLFTEKSKDGKFLGRNEYLQLCVADNAIIGEIQSCKISTASYANLHVEPV